MSSSRQRIGFLINPIAGMGGRVGLKGTDNMAEEARRRGAMPVADARAANMLSALKQRLAGSGSLNAIRWFTCSGDMGADILTAAGFDSVTVVYRPRTPSTADDTRLAVAAFEQQEVDLIVFCGGDGTARDICQLVEGRIPLLGIPSGVKMYSGVFGITPELTADLVAGFVQGGLEPVEVDVIDLDEEHYRKDQWAVRTYCRAQTPYEPSLLPLAKALIDEAGDADVKDAIADHLCERMRSSPNTTFVLGPGTTVQAIASRLGLEKTLLGIDAVRQGKLIASNLDEQGLQTLLSRQAEVQLVLSPLGAQGFVLGRGNLELSPAIVRQIGIENIVIVATPAKLARTPLLRFDTGDAELDNELARAGYLRVTVGYHRQRMAATGLSDDRDALM